MSVKIPEPRVKTARWVYVRETREDGNEYAYYRCSNCVMTEQDSFYPLCALCGAYMTNHEKFTRDLKAGKLPPRSHLQMLPLGIKKIDIAVHYAKVIEK